jgi:hypothetical protein
LELLIRDCDIVNNVVIVLRIIIGELVYLESAIYVLQNTFKSFTNNYQTRLKIIARYRYKLIVSVFSQHKCHYDKKDK